MKTPRKQAPVLHLKLGPDVLSKIDAIARDENRTRSNVVVTILKRALKITAATMVLLAISAASSNGQDCGFSSRELGFDSPCRYQTPRLGDGNSAVLAQPEKPSGPNGGVIGRFVLTGLIVADGLTTHQALKAGGREVLIPSQNEVVIQSALAAQAVGIDWLLGKVGTSHPTAARNLRIAFIASRACVVASNLHQLRKVQR